MDLQTGLRARLLADATVAANVGTRVYWVERPQGSAYPAIVLQVIDDGRPEHLTGRDAARPTAVRMDCRALTYAAALTLARAAIEAISDPAIISGKKFGHARIDIQRDLTETVTDGSVSGSIVHRQSVDLTVWHVGD